MTSEANMTSEAEVQATQATFLDLVRDNIFVINTFLGPSDRHHFRLSCKTIMQMISEFMSQRQEHIFIVDTHDVDNLDEVGAHIYKKNNSWVGHIHYYGRLYTQSIIGWAEYYDDRTDVFGDQRILFGDKYACDCNQSYSVKLMKIHNIFMDTDIPPFNISGDIFICRESNTLVFRADENIGILSNVIYARSDSQQLDIKYENREVTLRCNHELIPINRFGTDSIMKLIIDPCTGNMCVLDLYDEIIGFYYAKKVHVMFDNRTK